MSSSINEVIKSLTIKLGSEKVDGSIKFEIEDIGSIVVESGEVRESAEDTDCTLKGDLETFSEIFRGDLNSTTAFMSCRLKVEGSMGTAMKYNSILS